MAPTMHGFSRILGVLLVVTALTALPGAMARASCVQPPDLETAFAEAKVVFIGRVVELSNMDRTAVMEVESVWKGPLLPDVVTVNGGPDEPNIVTSVDRKFEMGTYVVFPINSTAPFEDNACTLTQQTTPALDVINPFAGEPDEPDPPVDPAVTTEVGQAGAADVVDIGATEAADSGPTSGSGTQLWVIGVGVAIGIGAVAVYRRRHITR